MNGPNGLLLDTLEVWIWSDPTILSNDYHQDIDSKTFFKWFKKTLLYLLDNSIVVMDNASVHNTRVEGTPKSISHKAVMQNWLMEQGVDFEPDAYKTELWEIIKERLIKVCPEYSVDILVQKEGALYHY